jgi:rod shape-determining protein MreD
MRRTGAIAVAGVLAMVLQTTIFPLLLPSGLTPNLLLVLVVYLGVHHFGAWGVLGAFVLGYFLDTFSGTVLGANAFAFVVIYLGVHHVARVLWTEGGVPAVLITFGAAWVHALLLLTITSLATAGGGVWHHAVRHGALGATVAAAATPAVFALVAWEQRMLRVG